MANRGRPKKTVENIEKIELIEMNNIEEIEFIPIDESVDEQPVSEKIELLNEIKNEILTDYVKKTILCPRCGGKFIKQTEDLCTCLSPICRKQFYTNF